MLVDFEITNNIGILSLNRPGTNSLNLELLKEIYNNLCMIEENKDIRVVILQSKLPFGFSSGLDLGGLFNRNDINKTTENVYNAIYQVYKISQKILSSPIIYIASLTGGVIGSSITIAASCDLRIAANNTWLWVPDPRYRGLLAEGGIEIMCELIGASRTAMLNLTNERFNAKIVHEWGLFYKLVERDEIKTHTLSCAEKISNFSYSSLKYTKKMINSGFNHQFPEKMMKDFLKPEKTAKWLSKYMK